MTSWRLINLIGATIGIIIWLMWTYKYKEHWGYAIAPLSYFLHVVVFYLCATYMNITVVAINSWSNGVRLHGIILGIGIGIVFLLKRRTQWTIQ